MDDDDNFDAIASVPRNDTDEDPDEDEGGGVNPPLDTNDDPADDDAVETIDEPIRPAVSTDRNDDTDNFQREFGMGRERDDDDDSDDANDANDNMETAVAVANGGTAENDIDDNENNTENNTETVIAHIRGTDIHVPTAAKTFLHFIRTFRSLQLSQRAVAAATNVRQNRNRNRNRNQRSSDDDEEEDSTMDVDHDSDDDTDDDDDDEPTPPPMYLNLLRDILHQSIGIPPPTTTTSYGVMASNSTSTTAATAATNFNNNADLTKSFTIDMIHLYYHNETCQQLYYQIVQHPMELIPLMDLLLQQQYERLLGQVVKKAADDGDTDMDADDVNNNDDDNDEADDDFDAIADRYGYANLNIDVENMIVPRIQVRPYNLKIVSNLRSLDPISMDTLICCKGMIVRCSSIIPDLKVAHFSCTICGHAVTVTIDRGRIAEPQRCPTCQASASYQLQHNRSIFADKQLIRLQETPDEVPAGQTPASVITFCYDTLVDSVVPGDKVEITGILRAQPIRINPKISKIKSIYKTYIDVIHFSKITAASSGIQKELHTELQQQGTRNNNPTTTTTNNSSISNPRNSINNPQQQWSSTRIEQLIRLSTDPDIYNKLVQSLAPSIWELDNCKKGILCMLFGGNTIRVKPKHQRRNRSAATTTTTTGGAGTSTTPNWLDDVDDDENENEVQSGTLSNGNHSAKLNKRGDINILLCGDPGTSKSQLLSYVNKLCTRGIYTSGKGSSAVGLTASVVRDPETREFALESGALVLSDLGICCIDEFDKMSDSTRSVLHEAMEQQTVSIAKAGIIATLHARTSVLASANPIESRYNPNRSVVDNIQLPPTLLSRFDLIYLILDAPNVEHDRRLAQHLVGLYYETPNVVEPPLDQVLLRDYIEYARQNVHPEISDEASSQLIESYLEMRNPTGGASNGTRTISATARQLESLIRLSEALAKMRYSSVVTRNDAKEAIRLMKVATQAAATDPRTGKIDMDMITTGRSSNTREMEEQLDITLQELFRERRGARMAVRDVTKQLNEINNAVVPHEDMVEGLRRMHADGIIQFNERTQTMFVRSTI